MLRLFRWDLHRYVVAEDFGDAERTIRTKYEHFGKHDGDTLENLGPYVQISRAVLAAIAAEESG